MAEIIVNILDGLVLLISLILVLFFGWAVPTWIAILVIPKKVLSSLSAAKGMVLCWAGILLTILVLTVLYGLGLVVQILEIF